MQPLGFKRSSEVPGTKAFEGVDRLGNVLARDQFVPSVAANQCGEIVARGGLAGAVEADDSSSRIEDRDQRAHCVQNRRDEVAFDSQGRLDTLARTGRTIHLMN